MVPMFELCPGCATLIARVNELERRHNELRDQVVRHVNRISAAIGRVDAEACDGLTQLADRIDALVHRGGDDPRKQEAEDLRPRPLFPANEAGPYAKGA